MCESLILTNAYNHFLKNPNTLCMLSKQLLYHGRPGTEDLVISVILVWNIYLPKGSSMVLMLMKPLQNLIVKLVPKLNNLYCLFQKRLNTELKNQENLLTLMFGENLRLSQLTDINISLDLLMTMVDIS